MSTMDVEAKESNNTENISNKSVVEVDEYYATDESEYEYDDDDYEDCDYEQGENESRHYDDDNDDDYEDEYENYEDDTC